MHPKHPKLNLRWFYILLMVRDECNCDLGIGHIGSILEYHWPSPLGTPPSLPVLIVLLLSLLLLLLGLLVTVAPGLSESHQSMMVART